MVRPYTAADHQALTEWAQARGMPTMPPHTLPKVGFVSPGVAMGFLYQTDSSIAQIDCFISNPVSDKAERDSALDEITQALLNKAKDLGFTHVKCETKLTSIGARAERHGFVPAGTFTYYVRAL